MCFRGTHAYMLACTCVRTLKCVRTHTHTYTHTRAHTHTTYTHTLTLTHTCTRAHTQLLSDDEEEDDVDALNARSMANVKKGTANEDPKQWALTWVWAWLL